jgi:hypothetical protein
MEDIGKKMREELDFFKENFQQSKDIQTIEEEDLTEMANLEPEETGLNYLIWIGPSPASHSDRIKVVTEKGKINPKTSFSLSIEDEPKVVAGKSTISAKELKKITNWIKKNKDILLQHARMEITDRQLRERIGK